MAEARNLELDIKGLMDQGALGNAGQRGKSAFGNRLGYGAGSLGGLMQAMGGDNVIQDILEESRNTERAMDRELKDKQEQLVQLNKDMEAIRAGSQIITESMRKAFA